MTLYAVFEKPRAAGAPDEPPILVPDKFSWLAALAPPVFALVHRLWIELLAFVLLMVALNAAANAFGERAGFWLYLAFAAWVGLEAAAIRRVGLRRRGFAYRGEVVARDPDSAMLAWFGGAPGR